MRIRELFEARRNPHLNPRIDPLDTFSMYARNPNMFVTYTKLPKVGINPKSNYNTPIGIYSYPLEYILKRAYGNGSVFGAAPFASESKYVHLFEQRSRNILDVSTYNNNDYNRDKQVLINYFSSISDEDSVRQAIQEYERSMNWHGRDTSGGKIIWFLIYNLMARFSRTRETIEATKILYRVLGYDAVYDRDGRGVIHENEPTQAVHFNIQTIRIVESFENRGIARDRQEARDELANMDEMTKIVELVETKHGRVIAKMQKLIDSFKKINNYDQHMHNVLDEFIETFKEYILYLVDLHKTIRSIEGKLLNIPTWEVNEVVGIHSDHMMGIVRILGLVKYNSAEFHHLNTFMNGFKLLTYPKDGMIDIKKGVSMMGKGSNELHFMSKLGVFDTDMKKHLIEKLADVGAITMRDLHRNGIKLYEN